MSNLSQISEVHLVTLRRNGKQAAERDNPFVNPVIISQCAQVLDVRGEAWAATVLGRDLTRRSVGVPHRPYLLPGEPHTLLAADQEEDRLTVAHLDT